MYDLIKKVEYEIVMKGNFLHDGNKKLMKGNFLLLAKLRDIKIQVSYVRMDSYSVLS